MIYFPIVQELHLESVYTITHTIMRKTEDKLFNINELFEMLFDHFFSKNRCCYSIQDVKGFIRVVCDQSEISQTILAYYFKQILKSDNPTAREEIQCLFNQQVFSCMKYSLTCYYN